MIPLTRTIARIGLPIITLLLVSGCSLHKANTALKEGRYDDAVAAYREVIIKNPNDVKARIGMQRASEQASEDHIKKAREAQNRGNHELMSAEVRKALVLNPNNQMAIDWLVRIEAEKEDRKKAMQETENLMDAQKEADAINPLRLEPKTLEGVDLNFPSRTSLKQILSSIGKATGINILYHTSFTDAQVSLDLRGQDFQKALDTLMLQNDNFYKVIDPQTIMIFKNTPQLREQHDNQLLKTYYLSNAEPDSVKTILTALVPTIRVFPDKRLFALIVKAKPHEMAAADRIIRQLDKSKAEVMVYVELMEVTENSLAKVGLLPVLGLSDETGIYRFGGTLDASSGPNQVSGFPPRITNADLRVLMPNLAMDMLKSSGDAKLVASPNLRVASGEKGKINIGEKVSTTQSALSGMGGFGATGTGGTTGTTGTTGIGGIGLTGGYGQTTFNYEQVGVTIEVEPRVHNDGDITLKLKSTVTTLTSEKIPGRPNIGNRDLETTARLKDGEVAIFGGLLKDEEQKSLQGIWGLTDIPLVGKLLGNTKKNRAKTDVILTVRPVLVRRPSLGYKDFEAFNPEDASNRYGAGKKKEETPKPEAQSGEIAPEKNVRAPRNRGTGSLPKAPGNVPQRPAEPPTNPVPPAAAPQPPSDPQAPATPPATPTPESSAAKPPEATPVASDLVFFMSPLNVTLAKGKTTQISILVSGGRSVTHGTLTLMVDPRLKLQGATAGDWLAMDQGQFTHAPGPNNTYKLTFNKAKGETDSGTLVSLTLLGETSGQAPLLIQSGTFAQGPTPISARWVNALVTVE